MLSFHQSSDDVAAQLLIDMGNQHVGDFATNDWFLKRDLGVEECDRIASPSRCQHQTKTGHRRGPLSQTDLDQFIHVVLVDSDTAEDVLNERTIHQRLKIHPAARNLTSLAMQRSDFAAQLKHLVLKLVLRVIIESLLATRLLNGEPQPMSNQGFFDFKELVVALRLSKMICGTLERFDNFVLIDQR